MLKKILIMIAMLCITSTMLMGEKMNEKLELRESSFKLDRESLDDHNLKGLAIAYKSDSVPLYDTDKKTKYIERIMPGAITQSIKYYDVKCLHQHDPKLVLGRTQNQTLKLRETIEGLYFEVDIPDTTWASDLSKSIKRGDIDKMSFGFYPLESRWLEDKETLAMYGMPIKEISQIYLSEISIVSNPAYSQTDVRELENVDTSQIENKEDIVKDIKLKNQVREREIEILKTRI